MLLSMSNERLELSILRALSNLIPELKDPRIPLIVTVERVNLSRDGKYARILVSTLVEDDMDEMMDALASATGHLQNQLAKTVDTRFVPKLSFHTNLLDALTWPKANWVFVLPKQTKWV